MGAHSGRFAVIDGVDTVESWSANILSAPQAYIASNTKGGTGRVPGVMDWNGSFNQRGGSPVHMPGDLFDFKGYTAPNTDILGVDGAYYEGEAIIDQVQITWNWTTGEPIAIVSNFSGNGEVEEGSDITTDVTDPAVLSPTGLRFTLGADEESGSDDDLCTSQAQLTITAANPSYVNSCTNNWTRRKAGPIDFSGSLTMHNDSGLALPFAIGDDVELWGYVSAAAYWILKWCHIDSFTGITCNRAGEIITMTVPFSMNGFNPSAGQIRLPGAGSDWWPFV